MSCPPLPPILAVLPVSSVASFPPPYMDFFLHGECDIDKQGWCHATGLCGQHGHGQLQWHVCPAQEGHPQSATALGPALLAVKLRSNTTAVWDHCAAGAYPVGQCFGDWHCMFSWLNSLLCLVTMSFCLPELTEDFLLFLWLKLRRDNQKNVFSFISMQQKVILQGQSCCLIMLSFSWPFTIRTSNIRMLSSSGKLLLITQIISPTVKCTLIWNRLLFLGTVIFCFI